MKSVRDLIEELSSLPPDILIYHFDGAKYTYPRLVIEETVIEGGSIKYLVIVSEEIVSTDSIETELE